MTRRGPGSLVVGLALLVQAARADRGQGFGRGRPRPPSRRRGSDPGRQRAGPEGPPRLRHRGPHGTTDTATDVIGRELAKHTGFGLVVATGYAKLDGEGRRYNVNRPTESAPGAAARLEVETDGGARRLPGLSPSRDRGRPGPAALLRRGPRQRPPGERGTGGDRHGRASAATTPGGSRRCSS